MLTKDKPYYLGGPMTGRPQFNFPAFDAAAADLREQGYKIVSPAELDADETREAALASADGSPGEGSSNGETWGDFLARDVKLIADKCGGMIVLPEWNQSKGARLESFVTFLCKNPIVYYPSLRKVPRRELVKAWLGPWFRPSRSGIRGFVLEPVADMA
jgi:hypothetical protein